MPVKIKIKLEILSYARIFILGLAMSLLTQTSGASGPEKKSVDLIVQGRYVVTMTDDNPVIENGAVAIHDGVIVAVGKAHKIATDYQAKRL